MGPWNKDKTARAYRVVLMVDRGCWCCLEQFWTWREQEFPAPSLRQWWWWWQWVSLSLQSSVWYCHCHQSTTQGMCVGIGSATSLPLPTTLLGFLCLDWTQLVSVSLLWVALFCWTRETVPHATLALMVSAVCQNCHFCVTHPQTHVLKNTVEGQKWGKK